MDALPCQTKLLCTKYAYNKQKNYLTLHDISFEPKYELWTRENKMEICIKSEDIENSNSILYESILRDEGNI